MGADLGTFFVGLLFGGCIGMILMAYWLSGPRVKIEFEKDGSISLPTRTRPGKKPSHGPNLSELPAGEPKPKKKKGGSK